MTESENTERGENRNQDRAVVQGNAVRVPLLSREESEPMSRRWEEIQASFVDRPQDSVEEADALVADLMKRLTGTFANERDRLEKQWAEGDDVSTEDLRVTLTRYRSFFDRLLSA